MKKIKLVLISVILLFSGCNNDNKEEMSGDNSGTAVTLENYAKISEGMSFDEVKKILGKPAKTIREIEVEGITAGTYEWRTQDENLVFVIGIENGKVKIKMPPQSVRK
jgi:hypothetical protein